MTHDEQGPAVVDEETLEEHDGTVFICRCGLSDDEPFCDSSHAETRDEDVRYEYENDDVEGERRVIEGVALREED